MRKPAQNSPPATSGPRYILTVLALGGVLAASCLPAVAESAFVESFRVETGPALFLRGVLPEDFILVEGSIPDPQRRAETFRDRGIGAIVAAGFRPVGPVPVPSVPRVPPPGSLPPIVRQHRCCWEFQFAFPEDVDPAETDLEGYSRIEENRSGMAGCEGEV